MKKQLLVFLSFILISVWLAGCAPAATAGPTPALAFVTPDRSKSTPTFGSVTVLSPPGAHGIFLRNLPDHKAAVSGEVQPGDTGKILGFDSTQTWALVEIGNQTGWAPVELLSYTIAQ